MFLQHPSPNGSQCRELSCSLTAGLPLFLIHDYFQTTLNLLPRKNISSSLGLLYVIWCEPRLATRARSCSYRNQHEKYQTTKREKSWVHWLPPLLGVLYQYSAPITADLKRPRNSAWMNGKTLSRCLSLPWRPASCCLQSLIIAEAAAKQEFCLVCKQWSFSITGAGRVRLFSLAGWRDPCASLSPCVAVSLLPYSPEAPSADEWPLFIIPLICILQRQSILLLFKL